MSRSKSKSKRMKSPLKSSINKRYFLKKTNDKETLE